MTRFMSAYAFNKGLFLLSLSLFLTGGAGLITQYVLATISSYLMGSTIEQFSITVAVMMGFMGVGSIVQRKLDDGRLLAWFILNEMTLAVLSGFAPIAIYWAFAGVWFQAVYLFFVAAIGFLIGLEIPLIIRLNRRYTDSLKSNLSWVFSMDYFGAMIGGGLVWTFLILPHVSLIQTGFVVSMVNLAVAMLTFTTLYEGHRRKRWLGVFAAVSILMAAGWIKAPDWERIVEQRVYDDRIVDTTSTPYQHIVITRNDQNNDLRLYLNGNIQFSSLDEKRYHDFLVHPVMNAGEVRDVLVLGGGDGLALRELNRYWDKGLTDRIVLVDIDRKMIEYAIINPYLSKLNRHSLKDYAMVDGNTDVSQGGRHVVIDDASSWLYRQVRNGGARFDVIIMDLPDPSNLTVNKLYTAEFFRLVRRMLKADGRLVVQSSSPFFAPGVFASIGATLGAAGFSDTLPYRFNIPSFGEWGWWMACAGQCVKPRRFAVDTAFVTPELFRASTHWGKGELVEGQVNTLMRPVLVEMYLKSIWR